MSAATDRAELERWFRFTDLAGHPVVNGWAVFITRDPSLPWMIAAAMDDRLVNPNYRMAARLRPLGLEDGCVKVIEDLIEAGAPLLDASRFVAYLIKALRRGDPPETNCGIA